MTWFKVDDGLAFHHKVVAAGNAAMGLWVRAGAASAQQLTDGFIADHMVTAIGNRAQAQRLVVAGLWERCEGGYVFHQWNEDGRQPTREQVENDRKAARERMAKRRGGSQDVQANNDGTSDVVRPPRPGPSLSTQEPSSEVADATSRRDDVSRLCKHLADRIESNGSKRPTISKRWHDAARLMLDADKRTEEQAHKAIDWCQSDEFWRGNVLSLPTLRQKYDALRLAAQRSTGTQNGASFDRAAPIPRGPWSLPTPPPDIADDPERYTAWRTEQYAEHRRQAAAS